ncbi:MAG: hypothetical protein ACNS62_17210 [Candidatus Cyclobacteriaceae bacterium M3_2C_046]
MAKMEELLFDRSDFEELDDNDVFIDFEFEKDFDYDSEHDHLFGSDLEYDS